MNEAEAMLAQVQAHLASGHHLLETLPPEYLRLHAAGIVESMARLLRTMRELQEIIDRGKL